MCKNLENYIKLEAKSCPCDAANISIADMIAALCAAQPQSFFVPHREHN